MSENYSPWSYFDYFVWLCNEVGAFTSGSPDHIRILRELHDTPFEWAVEGNLVRDENRAVDGKHLRHVFMEMKGVPVNMYGGMGIPASVLEVLVALSINIDNKLVAGNGEQARWFWLMLDNLGITDGGDIHQKIYRWLHREFDFDGVGSPFPLRDCKTDQRRIELWLQACGYFSEPYFMEV